MTAPASELASQAEAVLLTRFARLRNPTKYIATFRTQSERHIALTRQTKDDIYIWAENCPAGMSGIEIRNSKFPGQPYSAGQPRSSNLSNASKRLGVGNVAYYLKCETVTAMERFIAWYGNV
jgi:hypothetical protein